MNTFTVVAYQEGATQMNRRFDGAWRSERVAPGSISLLTRSVQSHWRWSEDIHVAHLYVSLAAMADVAADVYDRRITGIELFDILSVEDPVLSAIAGVLARESREGGLGGRLYVEALKNQACVHILRHYANVGFREQACKGGLSDAQRRRLIQYVDANLDQNISLADLAGVAQLGVFDLVRRFGKEFGSPPHAYVMRRRIEQAKRQLARRDTPLKVVAANCGFSDQSHMCRLFRRTLGVTPAEFRRQAAG